MIIIMEDYYKGVDGFINFTLSNLKIINRGGIRWQCVKCKNKKLYQSDVIMMHLLRKKPPCQKRLLAQHLVVTTYMKF